MLHTTFQGHRPFGSGEEFLRFLPYIGMATILVMWPGPFEQIFVPPSHGDSKWNLASICLVASEEKMRWAHKHLLLLNGVWNGRSSGGHNIMGVNEHVRSSSWGVKWWGICRNPTIHEGQDLDRTEIKSFLAIERIKPVVLVLFLYGSEAPGYEVLSRLLRILPPRKTIVHAFKKACVWRSFSACNPRI